jgi:putative ABC transport system ATP-binding protein
MLELHQVSQQYGQRKIIHQLSLCLPAKQLLVVTGASGSGKTTFLKVLNLTIPFTGSLRFEGIDLHQLDAKEKLQFRQHYLGVVYQGLGLIQTITVQDQIALVKAIKGPYEDGILKQAWFRFFAEVSQTQIIATLSRGQQQRLAILLACLGSTQLLLLDEPTTGLDIRNRQWLYELLTNLKKTYTIIMTTHQPLTDGLAYDAHLHFPHPKTEIIPLHPKKTLLPPLRQQNYLPLRWLLPFHLRYRRQQPYRKRLQLFQSVTFTMLGVMLSLVFLVRQEVLHLANTMLGGQYQWIQPHVQPSTLLRSSTSDDKFLQQYGGQTSFRHYYDETYFETLKPYHRFYVESDGFQVNLKDFHLGLINLYQPPGYLVSPMQAPSLNQHEIILGVQTHHLRTLSQVLHCFPTLSSVNQTLLFSPLSLYVTMFVPDWVYQDEYRFSLTKVIHTETPQWFHTDPDYAKLMYEETLRLPSKGIEEIYENAPWVVSKTMILKVIDNVSFLKDWRNDLAWQSYHLHRHPTLGWRIYRQTQPRREKPEIQGFPKIFHYHSEAGYHYYPDQALSGFAQPLFFHPDETSHESYIETLKAMSAPFDWLDVAGPSKSSLGYVLANPGSAVKYQVIDHPALKTDEVIVSKNLLNKWGLKLGERVHVTLASMVEQDKIGFITTTYATQLRVIEVRENEGFWLYQQPHWLEDWFLLEAYIPSIQLIPEAWISYQPIEVPATYQTQSPLATVQAAMDDIQTIMSWIIIGFLIGVGSPLWLLFIYFTLQAIIEDKQTMLSLKGYGSPWSMVRHWYQTKTTLIIGETLLPSIGMVLGLDALVSRGIRQYFYLPYQYQFPLTTFIAFGLSVGGFYLILLAIQSSTLKKHYEINQR